jgi:hypothetical protein
MVSANQIDKNLSSSAWVTDGERSKLWTHTFTFYTNPWYTLIPWLDVTKVTKSDSIRVFCRRSEESRITFFFEIQKWDWVFLDRTRLLSGIYQFIEFSVVETKRFVSSSVNVILTQQTCGQRSSMSTGSKRRALETYFSQRNWYMFLVSKCTGDWDSGLYTSWVHIIYI